MKKYNSLSLLLTLCFGLLFSACNIGGLDLLQNVKYNASPLQPNLNMTAYQFIQSRKNIDMFILSEAIERAGYRDSFEVSNRTYIVMNDVAFTTYLKDNKYADISFVPVNLLQTLLRQRTILGVYSSLELTNSVKYVQTSEPSTTLALSLLVRAIDDANRYTVLVSQNKAVLANKTVVTSNLKATNGIIHVIEAPL